MNVVKYCRVGVLAVLLAAVLASPLALALFSATGCADKPKAPEPPEINFVSVPPTEKKSEGDAESTQTSKTPNEARLEELQSKLTLAKAAREKIAPTFAKRQGESQKLRDQLTSAFGKLSDAECEDVKNAIKEGKVKEKFPNRKDVAEIKTTFDEWSDVESSLKKYRTLVDKYDEEINKGEALVKSIQRKIEDEEIIGSTGLETSGSDDASTTELLDSLKALGEESIQSDGEITPEDVNDSQETNDLLDKIVEDVKQKSEAERKAEEEAAKKAAEEQAAREAAEKKAAEEQAAREAAEKAEAERKAAEEAATVEVKKPEVEVDLVNANKRSAEGYEAFAKHDYLLAKQKGEMALLFDPNCEGAKKLLADAQVKLDELARSATEGNGLFDSGKYEEALNKAREIKSLCLKYPDADVLETKAVSSLVSALVAEGWKLFGLNDKEGALAKALEALELKPDDEDAWKLYDECDPFENTAPGSRAMIAYKGVVFAFRYCPSGSYTMGSPSSESGRFGNEDQRSVTISEGFWICETETTQEQWDAVGVKKEKECNFKGAKLPVESVSWNEYDAFIKKLNELGVAPKGWRFVLPTEEQWEYACRAGTTGSTYGVPLDEAAWYDKNSGSKTHEVGTKKPNKWGIFDMLGNVWEWTSSKYDGGFVFRGGYWGNDTRCCRPAVERSHRSQTSADSDLGARAALVRQSSKQRFFYGVPHEPRRARRGTT